MFDILTGDASNNYWYVFQYVGDVSWMDITFNDYRYETKYTWIESLGICWFRWPRCPLFPNGLVDNILIACDYY